jgi:hypothetical protein
VKIAIHLDLDIPAEREAFRLVKAKLHSDKVELTTSKSVDPATLPADGPQVLAKVSPFDDKPDDAISLAALKGKIAEAYRADRGKSDEVVRKLQQKGYGAVSSLGDDERKFAYNLFQTIVETSLPSESKDEGQKTE